MKGLERHKYESSATGFLLNLPRGTGGAAALNFQESGDSYEYVDSEEALLDKVGDVDGTRLVGGRIASTR